VDLKAPLLTALTLLLCSCGTADRPLTRQQISTIPDLEVVVGVAQDTLAVQEIDPVSLPPPTPQTSSSYQHSGYHRHRHSYRNNQAASDADLGAAVGEAVVMLIVGAVSARQESRRQALQARAAPLRQALDGYDFRAELMQVTSDSLSGVQLTKINVLPTPLTNSYDLPVRWAYDRSTASAVLFFFVSYSFDEGRGGYGLTFKSQALIFPKATDLKALRRRPDEANPIAEGNAIHLKKVEYYLPYDGGPNIREVLKLGAQALAAQLAADLEPAN